MRLLVSCDEYCFRFKGDYYLSSRGHLFAKRYLSVFDKVRFAIRTKEVFSPSDLKNYTKVDNPNVEIAEMPFFQGPKQYLPKYLKTKKAATKALEGCDCAIFRLPSTVGFAVWKKALKMHILYAVELVFDCYDAINSAESFIQKALWKKMHQWQVKASNNATGVSCVTSEYLQKHYSSKLSGAMATNYSSIELTPDFYFHERKYSVDDRFRIIHVANQVQFNSRKGHNQLIKAVAKLNQQGKSVEITFVGGDYQDGINKLTEYADSLGIKNHVSFTGFVNIDRMREELKKANLAVLPTKAEGLPRVVIEAMAMGLPCITSPVSGNPELINKEMLVEYYDEDSLVNAISRLINSPELYESESKINFERSKEYSNEILNPRRNAFYQFLKNKTLDKTNETKKCNKQS